MPRCCHVVPLKTVSILPYVFVLRSLIFYDTNFSADTTQVYLTKFYHTTRGILINHLNKPTLYSIIATPRGCACAAECGRFHGYTCPRLCGWGMFSSERCLAVRHESCRSVFRKCYAFPSKPMLLASKHTLFVDT